MAVMKTTFLEGLVGECGENEVLLDKDVDLSSNIGKDGFKVVNAFSADRFNLLKTGVSNFLREGLIMALGIKKFSQQEEEIGRFVIEKYHLFANDDACHEKVMKYIRHGIIVDNDGPHKLGFSENELSKIVGNAIGHSVRVWLKTCNIRVTRPNSSDNNPLHRDVYLARLRNKINIYLPVSGSTEESALAMIPGSHRWPESEISKTPNYATYNGRKFTVPAVVEVSRPEVNLLRVSPAYGDLNIFSPYLIHGGGSNPGTETRCSLEVRFCSASEIAPHKPISKIASLGAGTLWYGLEPVHEDFNWKAPKPRDILSNQLMPMFEKLKGNILVDTAPAYRGAEELLGRTISSLEPEVRGRLVIGTKIGEYYNSEKGTNITDYSLRKTHESLANSHSILGALDLIYMHVTSQLSTSDAIMRAIGNSDLFTELMDIRESGKYGCRLLGVTVSNSDLLKSMIHENLLPNFDVLQVPAGLVRQNPDLLIEWKKRRTQNKIVVNSTIRHKPSEMSIGEAYNSVLTAPFVDVVLCGSRNNVDEALSRAQ